MRTYHITDFVPEGHAPTKNEMRNLSNLAELVLTPILEKLDTDITITSGLRLIAKNLLVGGVMHSDHLFGSAVDFVSANPTIVPTSKFFLTAIEIDVPYRQCIYSKRGDAIWLHISVNHKDNPYKHEAFVEDNGKFTLYNKGDKLTC